MQIAKVETNNFSGGLITEVNPLDFPPNASFDEQNMALHRDGTRHRRLGFDLETSYVSVDTGVTFQEGVTLGTSQFKWKNPGGLADRELVAIQVGNHLAIYDMDEEVLSANQIYERTHDVSTYSEIFSYAVVDGILVVVNGLHDVYQYTYDGTTVTESTKDLLIRDLFGVDDGFTGDNNLQNRPTTLSDEHLYNLRNQTWAIPRRKANTETDQDAILSFFQETTTKYPSNADNVNVALRPDPDDTDNRIIYRFFASDLRQNPSGTIEAPRGHFIIDALERGPSRETKEDNLNTRYTLNYAMAGSLPADTTPGGARVVSQYAGRFWYAGFSGEVTDGDASSPKLSSYVLFSQLIKDSTDVNKCYQKNDPTSSRISDLLSTDGGFIRLEGAYGIKSMVDAAGSLFVFATNGVWRISGDAEGGFSATAYRTEKLSEDGCIAAGSVVLDAETIYYWTREGIHRIARNEYGQWITSNISEQSIQTFYDDIPLAQKESVKSTFDSFEHSVRWVYGDELGVGTDSKELVFNTTLEAFSPFTVNVSDGFYPRIVGVFEANPRLVFGSFENDPRVNASREALYLALLDVDTTINYSFGAYKDVNFGDWGSLGTAVDSPAYLLTGYITAGDSKKGKWVPYITIHMKKTETGFTSDFEPVGPSSCMFSTQWDWTNSANANRWTTPRQVYKHRKLYAPETSADTFDDGNFMVTTKNRVRGSGKSVAMKFESSSGYDMVIIGWSYELMVKDK